MKAFYFAACAALVSAVALAERPQGNEEYEHRGSQITVSVNGLNCSTGGAMGEFDVHSWSWSATNTGSASNGSGAGTGKASVGNLMIKKAFDACSPLLLGAVTQGKHFNSLVLTQEDYNGNVVATVRLTEVLVSSWSVGSTARDADPEEAVAFSFSKVCLATGTTTACYDLGTGGGA